MEMDASASLSGRQNPYLEKGLLAGRTFLGLATSAGFSAFSALALGTFSLTTLVSAISASTHKKNSQSTGYDKREALNPDECTLNDQAYYQKKFPISVWFTGLSHID